MENFPDKFGSEESFKDLFDHAHDLIHMVDPGGNLLYVNNAWMRILGYAQEEVHGRSIYSLIVPEDQEWFRDYRNGILNAMENNSEVVVRFRSKSGLVITMEGFISLRSKNGQPYYTRGIFRDISAKVADEASLIEREKNLQQLLLNAPDAIIVINKESLITYWNPQAEKIFGYQSEEVLGRPLSEQIIPPQYREAHKNGMERFLTTGQTGVINQTIEITALNKSGEEFYVSLTISTTQQNGEVAFIAFLRDIRQQKKNDEELRRKGQELEASNQQLEQFAHVASHDMKEPIRKILFFSDLLRTDIASLNEKQDKYLQKIHSAADRLYKMVDGVLTFASSGNSEIAAEPVDLNTVIKEIEADLEVIVMEKHAIVTYNDLPVIKGDPFLMYQLFFNLFNNSLKFSRPGQPPVIEITAYDITDPVLTDATVVAGHFTVCKVKDNGIGFADDNASDIFKTFTRLHSRSEFEGTGLGLSLCKRIMERHGGYIEAAGKPGMGAVFTLLFPA